jgi:hypothetical protein
MLLLKKPARRLFGALDQFGVRRKGKGKRRESVQKVLETMGKERKERKERRRCKTHASRVSHRAVDRAYSARARGGSFL